MPSPSLQERIDAAWKYAETHEILQAADVVISLTEGFGTPPGPNAWKISPHREIAEILRGKNVTKAPACSREMSA